MCDIVTWFAGTKAFWQAAALFVATIGGPITAGLAIGQAVANRAQRKQDLRWKQAELARELSEEVWKTADSHYALEMIDFRGRTFTLPSQKPITIQEPDVLAALRLPDEPNDEQSVFIRDCFDELFYFFERFEHSIRIGLITFEDVRFPWEYYAGVLARYKNTMVDYNRALFYDRALAFLNRFDQWRLVPSAAGNRSNET
jgi:hypothetical protein